MTTTEQLYDIFLRHPTIQTDTRKLRAGDLFFALKGPNFNGNQFAARALELGAAYTVIDEAPPDDSIPPSISDRLLVVPDTLKALQALALHHRRQFTIPFIAITGSNGKTTTKELIHAVLSSTWRTYTTQGNLNNHIGVPITILSVRADAEFAVIEMGANHQKEIEGYCQYTLPTHGLITNVGKAHLEGFGGPEGVKKGKGELFDFLRSTQVPELTTPAPVSGGTAFVMWDYDYLREMSRGIPHIIKYGTQDADITGKEIDRQPELAPSAVLTVGITSGADIPILPSQLVGDYNLPNILAAVAVGKHFGVADAAIKKAIEEYEPSNSRSQRIEKDGNNIVLDAYNANPSSMRAAIENFAIKKGDKVLILGAMAELGPESLNEHRAIVDLIGQYKWKDVVLVGGDFEKIDHPYHRYADSREAREWLRQAGLHKAYILVKGSRSMKMEEVVSEK
ncbi:MAG TPA: UDP-N-acetylmuramoyl-tripeptide--D-alanyl-D-alanine ligase [Puia sp.]|nr:UDP-N-acetylmuramoyl-tripeptide--D-alanyl-D-alanine ligase [Puia sp.]